jgi:hypothetical protein
VESIGVKETGQAPDKQLLERLSDDGVEHLWVAYTDYNGLTQF